MRWIKVNIPFATKAATKAATKVVAKPATMLLSLFVTLLQKNGIQ